ncbi:MAG: glycosyltransferase [Muribaculaceae bacterium]|nr:glycosyltransferase [Muribaculaceae bacterium]
MKVVLVNHSDMQGGAAIVSLRLVHALQDAGVDARMLVTDKQSDDALVGVMGGKCRNKWNFLAERLGVFTRNGFNRDTLFKIDTGSHGVNIASHPWVKDADVVCLNWINQGTMSLKSIKELAQSGKPIVWTMHDMWNCTGVCHHAYECERYKDHCHTCPLLKKQGDDLSTTIQNKKRQLYSQADIRFVAVSNWLASKCRESSLMHNSYISVIANAFPVEKFSFKRLPNADYGIERDKKVVVMGAARLDDTVKGFDQLIAATRHIAEHNAELAQRLHLLLFGVIKDASLLEKLALPYTHLGVVDDVARVYAHGDVVLSTSLYETLPGTLIEGQASGCLPVTFGKGGQSDIVEHLKTGYIAEYKDPASVAKGIEWALEANISREFLHSEVERKFSAAKIAQQYIELFDKVTRKN